MHEDTKVAEAQYFLNRLRRARTNPTTFQFNLSAFLSASRSVAQYALNEASSKQGGKNWYDTFLRERPLMAFLATERNANIHHRPSEPGGYADVYASDQAHFMESATVEKFDIEGNLIDVVVSHPDPPPVTESATLRLEFHYRFDQWSGPEEVPALCEQYLASLKELVDDGRRRGFLST